MNDYENRLNNDDDHYDGPIFESKNVNVRLNFIKKVYTILCTQLLFTALLIVLGHATDSYKTFLLRNLWLIVLASITTIVTCYALVCYKQNARMYPRNYILLAIFTACEAFIVSFITTFSPKENVMIAAALTAAMVIGLTIYAIRTKEDFTLCGGFLFMCLLVLCVASIMCLFFHTFITQILLSTAVILLFGLYIIYDTQLIVGDRARALCVDDYIIGALMLYIDIIRIFIEILKILNKVNR